MSDYHEKKYPVLFTMQMTEKQHEALMLKAQQMGISAAEVIRRMLR